MQIHSDYENSCSAIFQTLKSLLCYTETCLKNTKVAPTRNSASSKQLDINIKKKLNKTFKEYVHVALKYDLHILSKICQKCRQKAL